ncbi:hypothetical protein MSKU3_0536 [Komagataeibacter oboediens]|nr:hypothetical protein MSKU3_0536 [Komagataeibacter oboediens]
MGFPRWLIPAAPRHGCWPGCRGGAACRGRAGRAGWRRWRRWPGVWAAPAPCGAAWRFSVAAPVGIRRGRGQSACPCRHHRASVRSLPCRRRQYAPVADAAGQVRLLPYGMGGTAALHHRQPCAVGHERGHIRPCNAPTGRACGPPWRCRGARYPGQCACRRGSLPHRSPIPLRPVQARRDGERVRPPPSSFPHSRARRVAGQTRHGSATPVARPGARRQPCHGAGRVSSPVLSHRHRP